MFVFRYKWVMPMIGIRGLINRIYDMSERQVSFEVGRAEVLYELNGKITKYKDRHVLYVKGTGRPISVVSGRYQILQPKEFIDAVKSIANDIGEVRYWLKDDYSRIEAAIIPYEVKRIEIDGDEWNVAFRFVNSYDGTTAAWATGILYRVICGNGAIAHKLFMKAKVIHTDRELVSEFREGVNHVATKFMSKVKEKLERYTEMYVERSKLKQLFTKNEWERARYLLETKGFSEATQLLYVRDDMISVYDALNIITYFTTHLWETRHKTPLSIERKQTNMINKLMKILKGEEAEIHE